MLSVIEDNLNAMYEFVDTRLKGISCIRAEGTYLAWMDMRVLGLSDSELTKLCDDADLVLDMGEIFGTNGSGFTRWNVALPKEDLIAALERLEKAVKPLLDKHGAI